MIKPPFLLPLLAWHLGLVATLAQPVITRQPQPQAKFAGESALLSVEATGMPPLTFQWLKASAPLDGQTATKLLLTNLQATDRGTYAVIVSDAAGPVTSDGVELTVVTPPTITPANPTASLFADLKLTAKATPAGPVTYQWSFKGEPIAGEQAVTLTLTNIQKIHAGDYSVVAGYSFGAITSAVATLKITPFNSMYCFGYSWTDTHNCTWDASKYYKNHACNGPMWPELLSTNLGLVYVGNNNYAVCGAGPLDVLNQVASSLTRPPKPELSLFCLMFSDDILSAVGGTSFSYVDPTNVVAWNKIITNGILGNSNAVQRLYARGARTIVAQGEIDGGLFPLVLDRLGNDSVRLAKVSEYCRQYDEGFHAAVNAIAATRPDLHLVWVDLFSKINQVVANPGAYGFTKSTIEALHDLALTDKSLGGPGADYVFWDGLHGTSKLNSLEAEWTREALDKSAPETLATTQLAGESLTVQLTHLRIGRDYTFQKSTDMVAWGEVQAFTASAGTNKVQQMISADVTAATFYRLQWQP